MIQEEWEESLRQLEMIVSIVLLPFFGKWFGRQWAYWGESMTRFHTGNRKVKSTRTVLI